MKKQTKEPTRISREDEDEIIRQHELGKMTKTKSQIQTEIARLQEKLKEIEENEKFNELIYIKELKIYVEKNLHTEMDRVNKIIIPKEYRLLELSELIFIYNNYQDKFNWGKDKFFDELVKQPIKDCEYPYFNAWLPWLGGGDLSGLVGNDGDLIYCSAVRGVRFAKMDKKPSVKHNIQKNEHPKQTSRKGYTETH
jgi:hypothetical protein